MEANLALPTPTEPRSTVAQSSTTLLLHLSST